MCLARTQYCGDPVLYGGGGDPCIRSELSTVWWGWVLDQSSVLYGGYCIGTGVGIPVLDQSSVLYGRYCMVGVGIPVLDQSSVLYGRYCMVGVGIPVLDPVWQVLYGGGRDPCIRSELSTVW